MSTFYVDLSLPLVFPPVATGASNDPFDALQFLHHTNQGLVVDHTYKLWGHRDTSHDWLFGFGNMQFNIAGSNKITISSWEREFPLHSPWRLKGRVILFNRCPSIEGGFIETSESLILASDGAGNVAKTMFLRAAGGVIKGKSFKGCTLHSRDDGRLYIDGPTEIIDSILDCTIELHVNGDQVSLSHSASTFNNEFGQLMSLGDGNQFNWWARNPFPDFEAGFGSYPAPDDTKIWQASRLAAGINIAGSGSFSGYSTGLFGEARLGIGALFFNEWAQSSMSWVYNSDYSGTPAHLRKKYRQEGMGVAPSAITVPPTTLTATRALKDDFKDFDNSEYSVNFSGS